MNIMLKEAAKWCAVERDENPSPAKIRRAILKEENVLSDFSIITVPALPRDQTVFKICGNDKVILIGIALFDAMPIRSAYQKQPVTESAEIYFDPRHDHIGWFRFEFTPNGTSSTTFLPYPEAHTSDYPLLRVQKHQFQTEYFPSGSSYAWRCHWVFAWFDAAEVFRYGDSCGFNICRYRPDTSYEFSSWNYLSGNGGPDATAFGNLYQTAPEVQLAQLALVRNGSTLQLSGAAHGLKSRSKLNWEARGPLGESVRATAAIKGNQWSAAFPFPKSEAGRYRFFASLNGTALEPAALEADLPATKRAGKARPFTASMTWDWPDDLMANYYTPERLDAQIKIIKDWGINRIHWIDYSNAPSFWAMHYWDDTYKQTVKHCGDVVACAAEQAHANGLELVADFKVFDIGINTFHLKDNPCTVQELEGCRSAAIPEIVAHREWTQQTNAAWRREAAFPITRLRFYSRTPLPEIDPSAINLLVSRDNQGYKKYKGPLQIGQGTVRRGHARWTPAGKQKAAGAERNWYLEITGLELKLPFAALQIAGDNVFARQQGFMLMEAENSRGEIQPLTTATTGHRDFNEEGYFFGKEWPGWNNYTEPMVMEREWRLNDIGFTFQEIPDLPTLLEPSYEGARDIWLRRIEKLLDAGVDGVCIRIYNHHNGILSWLQFAFAPAVVEAFEERYGRTPDTTPADYEAIRRLRGEFFTQFMRDAKKLTSKRGKKLMVQLESVEVPPHLDVRMQLFLDYQTWIDEGIVDEVLMKDWTSQSPWVHENVLPRARRRGIPVHIISRCLNNGLDHTAMLTTPPLVANAYRAGFSGFDFYEMANLMELNPEGVPMDKAYSGRAITQACRELRQLQGIE